MLDSWLAKTKLKDFNEKLVKKIFYNRISANKLTIIGFFIGLLSAFFIFLSGFLPWPIELIIISIILMVISFVFDTFDGTLARLEEPSIFGGMLDIICDRTVEVSIIIALISTNPNVIMWPGIFTLGSIILCITMFLVVGGAIEVNKLEKTQKVIHYRFGLMERSETFLFLLIIVIIVPWRFYLLWIFAILVMITAILRFRDAYHIFYVKNENELKKQELAQESSIDMDDEE